MADSSLTGPDDLVELRVHVKRKYIDVMDAVAQSQPGANRGTVCNHWLAEKTAQVRHAAMLVVRMSKRNGIDMEEPWKNSAFHSGADER